MAWTDPESYVDGQIISVTNLHKIRDNMRELWHEVAYTEFTADVTLTATVEATPTDVVSSGAITYAANSIIVEFFSPWVKNATGDGYINLWDDTTNLGRLVRMGLTGSLSANSPVFAARRLTPTAASHTYKIRGTSSTSATVVSAGAGGIGALMPGYIRILQKGGA